MRAVILILIVSGVLALTYYLLIRPFEFEVKFTTRTIPGDVIETIRIWNRSLENGTVTGVDSFKSLSQTIVWQGRTYEYKWNFHPVSDSITRINVQISEPGQRIMNKLMVPFGNPVIEKHSADIVHHFRDVLQTHLQITRVKLIGETQLDSSFCVCSTVETSQIEKANGMIKDYPRLASFVDQFRLQGEGAPMVRVEEWDHNSGKVKFDFCFPIVYQDSLPHVKTFKYKHIGKYRVLKAEYYGNYITSDRAWYELIAYAERNGYKIAGFPIEHFHDNPNMGLNEREWKADVFLPVTK